MARCGQVISAPAPSASHGGTNRPYDLPVLRVRHIAAPPGAEGLDQLQSPPGLGIEPRVLEGRMVPVAVPHLDEDAAAVRGEPATDPRRPLGAGWPLTRPPPGLAPLQQAGFPLAIPRIGRCAYRIGDDLGDEQFYCVC